MSLRLESFSFDELYVKLLQNLWNNYDYECSPRGNKIKELLVPTLVLKNPLNRILTLKERNANYGFAVGEFLWYWRGAQDLESMFYYNKRMKNFSNDGTTLNSAYGYRLKGWKLDGLTKGASQWEICIKTLQNDKDSRRAVMHINDPRDQYIAERYGSKDVPCTLSLQFFIRDDELHLHTVMRSNDVIWGLTYDLFSFTLLQECMLLELKDRDEKFKDLKLGKYYHTAGSMHIYENHFNMVTNILDAHSDDKFDFQLSMNALTSIDELNSLVEQESLLRLNKIDKIDKNEFKGSYWWMAHQLNMHRKKRNEEENKK